MADERPEAAWQGRRLHLIGVGGAGMSGLAAVADSLGAEVSGSDAARSPYFDRLAKRGINVSIGHDPGNLPRDGGEVVVSTAIGEDNLELAEARSRDLPVLHRSELLAEVAALKRVIAVAGTHGKTTTAGMVAHVLRDAGQDPGYLIGGDLRSTGQNAGWGAGEWAVIEADESDRSFLALTPEVAVLTNVELDHHSHWRSLGELRSAFAGFAASAPAAIAWHPLLGELGLTEHAELSSFGVEEGDVRADVITHGDLGSRFEVEGVELRLAVPGTHNILNALAALAACLRTGLSVEQVARGLRSFSGARRRFEPRGRMATGATVFDDYAHHPTEVRATLEAARASAPGRVIACFQPHLYSRTERLAAEFGAALALADIVCVLEIYPARERAEDFPGVSGWSVAAAAADEGDGRPVYWMPTLDHAATLVGTIAREGDYVLTLGAGDVDRVAESIVVSGGQGR
ncbi:MAG: UDP-N-acetylmuramate--L-alanine ligase [Thermoleophilaceae bacterium]|nr:UDP-N-acetylmuramate--L-alanine ligase [Thermoleophilaceae bacterium]